MTRSFNAVMSVEHADRLAKSIQQASTEAHGAGEDVLVRLFVEDDGDVLFQVLVVRAVAGLGSRVPAPAGESL